MATILGTCGCCGDACATVKTSCNFVLRKFDNNTSIYPEWNELATAEDKACFAAMFNDDDTAECPYTGGASGNISFGGGGMSICTGEGTITRSIGYEGGGSANPETIGTYTLSYSDESIDFDNIGEFDLADAANDKSFCTFSYNFSFTPEEGVDYYIIGLPCDDSRPYYPVNLESDGRAYFRASFNGYSEGCRINQTYVPITPPAADTNAPESQ